MWNFISCGRVVGISVLAMVMYASMVEAAAAPAAAPAAMAVAATQPTWELSAVFDKTIQEKGLEVRRDRISAQEVTVAGKKMWTWGVRGGSAKDVPWGRSIFFKVTDDRFKQGKQPAVDIEVVYYKENNAPMALLVDGEKGSQAVTSAYWGNKNWQTLRARVDGAFFGARQHGNADRDMKTDGFDIRLNSFNEDFYIRSIKVVGYDLDENVDYQRLFKLEGVTAKNDLLLFAPGQKDTLSYKFWNMAHKPVDGELSYTITDREGKVLRQGSQPAVIAGGKRTELPVEVDTAGFKYGVYSVNLSLKDRTGGKELLQHESYLGVCSETAVLPKAADGEFLYGLDVCLGDYFRRPRLVKWTDVMGVDIVRGGGFEIENRKEVDAGMALWGQHGVRVLANFDPPKDMNKQAFDAALERKVQAGEDVARKYKQMKYWELGNEPDLPGFFPGTMAEYTRAYSEMYKAVKLGNPDAVVGSGGLSFAGETATARAKEFVKLVDVANVDVWAYHGHGALVKAERRAFENMRRTVREAGKDVKPYMETESGVAARQKSQEDMQAKTAIEKMVYAQSLGQPLFIWFRLLMFEEDYGNLRTEQEPRPVILSYRAMVEALRHHQFKSLVDLDSEETEGYLFEENGGSGRALVMWANRASSHNAYLSLGSAAGQVRQARVLDLFGNGSPVEVSADGTVQVTVNDSPVFLKWETSEPAYVAKITQGLLSVPAMAQVVFGKENRVSMQVRNPSDSKLATVVKVQASGKVPVEVAPAQQTLTLQPREKRLVEFAVKVGEAKQQVQWPEAWKAFAPVDSGVDLTKLTSVPETIPAFGGTGEVSGQRVYLKDFTIDFTKLGVKYKEKLPAVVMATVESDSDQTVTMGAAADYWMAWYVNGQPVYDTLVDGNGGGYSILDHTFKVSLKKGKNLLACKVLSGSQGFKVLIGSPTAVAKTRQPREADMLKVAMIVDGKEVARDQVGLEYVLPVSRLQGVVWTDTIEQWDAMEPTAILDGSAVHNFWFKEPDSSKWWAGEKDLSAVSWLACDQQKLYVIVRVKDDVQVGSNDAAGMAQCDSLQLAISRQGKTDVNEYTIGLVGGKVVVVKTASAYGTAAGVQDGKEIEARVERVDARGETIYRVALDRSLVGKDTFFANFMVNDQDAGYRKQAIEWRPGMVESKEPTKWYRAALPE